MKTRIYSIKRTELDFLLIPATAFQMWDAVMTFIYVNAGLAREGNPFMAPLLHNGSFLFVRFSSIALAIYLIYILSRFSIKAAKIATLCVLILYLGVVIWNYYVLLCM
jgi:hypothetical protein